MNDLQDLLNMIFESHKKEKQKEQEKKVLLADAELQSIKDAAAVCKKVYDEFTKVGFSEDFAEESILKMIEKILKMGD